MPMIIASYKKLPVIKYAGFCSTARLQNTDGEKIMHIKEQ
jgi:hypothetical protein